MSKIQRQMEAEARAARHSSASAQHEASAPEGWGAQFEVVEGAQITADQWNRFWEHRAKLMERVFSTGSRLIYAKTGGGGDDGAGGGGGGAGAA